MRYNARRILEPEDLSAEELDRIRHYLRDQFAAHGVELKAASLAIGRGPTYIQEYIGTPNKAPKPKILNEENRQQLVSLYPFLDEDRLRPPKRPLPGRKRRVDINPEVLGDLSEQGVDKLFFQLWPYLKIDLRIAILTLVMALTENSSTRKIDQADDISHSS